MPWGSRTSAISSSCSKNATGVTPYQWKSRRTPKRTQEEGEKTNENPKELIKQLDQTIKELENLISRINLTNSLTKVNKVTLTELIAKKDALQKQITVYQDIIYAASQNTKRATRTEIKVLTVVDVKALQNKLDKLSKEYRLLDNTIQETNWKTELK